MKLLKFTILFLMTISSVVASKEAKAQDETINFSTFQNQLSPYGTWINNPRFGAVWIYNDPSFRPYATNGHWDYTNYGWSWVSDFDWGWAPFHYGRWEYDPSYGWMWIPGYQWASAWVSWSECSGYYGWAPLGYGLDIGVTFNAIPYNRWNFIPSQYMGNRDFYNHYVYGSPQNNYFRNAVTINNYYAGREGRFMRGPEIRDVQRYNSNRIEIRQINYRDRLVDRNNNGFGNRPAYNNGDRNNNGFPHNNNAPQNNPGRNYGNNNGGSQYGNNGNGSNNGFPHNSNNTPQNNQGRNYGNNNSGNNQQTQYGNNNGFPHTTNPFQNNPGRNYGNSNGANNSGVPPVNHNFPGRPGVINGNGGNQSNGNNGGYNGTPGNHRDNNVPAPAPTGNNPGRPQNNFGVNRQNQPANNAFPRGNNNNFGRQQQPIRQMEKRQPQQNYGSDKSFTPPRPAPGAQQRGQQTNAANNHPQQSPFGGNWKRGSGH